MKFYGFGGDVHLQDRCDFVRVSRNPILVNDETQEGILVCKNRHLSVFRVTPASWMELSGSAS